VETSAIERGMVVVTQGSLVATSILDVDLELLATVDRPLRTRAKVLLHLGTGIAEATVTLLDRAALEPGERAPVQLTLGSPVAALAGQRFIVRGFAAHVGRGHTLGGGVVLDPSPKRHRHKKPEAATQLEVLREGAPEASLLALIREGGYRGAKLKAMSKRLGIADKIAERALGVIATRGEVVLFDKAERESIAREHLDALRVKAKRLLGEQAEANPLARSLSREALRSRLGEAVGAKLLARIIDDLVTRTEAELDGESVRAPGGRGGAQGSSGGKLVEQVALALEKAALAPPRVPELATALKADPKHVLEALRLLKAEGKAVRVVEDMYFAGAAIADLRTRLVAHLRAHPDIDIQGFKELVGQTRKFTVPLGEYFDQEKVTLRVGDRRVLRSGAS
jgi:selenocysteine-specific elongation factor